MPNYTNRTFFEQRKRLTLLAKLDLTSFIAGVQTRTRAHIHSAAGSPSLQRFVHADIIESLLVAQALKLSQTPEYGDLASVDARAQYLEPRIVDYLINWLQTRVACAADTVLLLHLKKVIKPLLS